MACPRCTCTPGVPSSPYKDTCPIGLGPTLVTSFNLGYFLKDSISLYFTLKVGTPLCEFGENHNLVRNAAVSSPSGNGTKRLKNSRAPLQRISVLLLPSAAEVIDPEAIRILK